MVPFHEKWSPQDEGIRPNVTLERLGKMKAAMGLDLLDRLDRLDGDVIHAIMSFNRIYWYLMRILMRLNGRFNQQQFWIYRDIRGI